jgi:trehalose 6-phosphate synthase/phosphatase
MSPDGWNPSIPVIIASNRLPVRLTRREVTTDLATIGTDGSIAPSYVYDIEWAGDRVIEAQNSFSHHELSERASIRFVGRIPEWDIPIDDQPALAQQLEQYNCYPIFVPAEEARLYYEEYCKQTLWPTFHNVIDVYSPIDVIPEDERHHRGNESTATYWTPEHQKLAWQAYANVNQVFAWVGGTSVTM